MSFKYHSGVVVRRHTVKPTSRRGFFVPKNKDRRKAVFERRFKQKLFYEVLDESREALGHERHSHPDQGINQPVFGGFKLIVAAS